MTSYFCTIKPRKLLLLIWKTKPSSNMNSILGDSHHHQEFNWVKKIRCEKNKTYGLREVIRRHSVTFPYAGDPAESNGDHNQVPIKLGNVFPFRVDVHVCSHWWSHLYLSFKFFTGAIAPFLLYLLQRNLGLQWALLGKLRIQINSRYTSPKG